MTSTCPGVMHLSFPSCTVKHSYSVREGCLMDNPLAENFDITSCLAEFVDKKYLFIASVSGCWRDAWGQYRTRVTAVVAAETSVFQLSCRVECGFGLTVVVGGAIAKLVQSNLLHWARESGCPWDIRKCSSAARGVYLNVLQWARSKSCPWADGTCSRAANGDHLHVLRWALSNGCPWDQLTCSRAAEGGHLDVLQWARGNGCP